MGQRLDRKQDVAAVVEEFLTFPVPPSSRSSSTRMPASIPMVGPGLGYDAMITGDFIAARSQAAAPGEVDPSGMF